jgi:3-phytase
MIGLRPLLSAVGLFAVAIQPRLASAAVDLKLGVTAVTSKVESDWTSVYYSKTQPLLLGNDGEAATGGFHVWDINGVTPLPEIKTLKTGRTKVVATVYGIAGKDYAVTIAQPDSIIRVFGIPGFSEVKSAQLKALGDWSSLCPWKSKSLNQYFFLFGKKQAMQFLIRKAGDSVEIVEVRHFPRT